MAITIDGKTYRNIPEQVAKNAEDIEDILTTMEDMPKTIDGEVSEDGDNVVSSAAIYSFVVSMIQQSITAALGGTY